MSKHTPGEWMLAGTDIVRPFIAKNGVVINQLVATARKSTYVNGKYIAHPVGVVEANARLRSSERTR